VLGLYKHLKTSLSLSHSIRIYNPRREKREKREEESEEKRESVGVCPWDSSLPFHVLNRRYRITIPAFLIPFLGKKS
ncbi:hypothetical protein PJP07_29665, partial [Mycobacterium kansasii]